MEKTRKAVVLSRGLGTRMRAGTDVGLSQKQNEIAALGIKALVPIMGGKTMLDLLLERLFSAGLNDVCLVIGPEHDEIRKHCEENRLDVSFAIQQEPKGTSDAVLAAEEFVGTEKFIVINSDNLYPVEDLVRLRDLDKQGLVAFDRERLISGSNIPQERISAFADVVTEGSLLRKIIEKPERPMDSGPVSMNLWLFEPSIFRACRSIEPSVRGEYEITAAVNNSIEQHDEEFFTLHSTGSVLDLSSRTDITEVVKILSEA
jgi:dTDP-glucose pyrophosphorylase